MRRLWLGLAAVALAGVMAGSAQALTVQLDREHVATGIGRHFTFTSTIEAGDGGVSGLVAHLNVLSNDPGVYVDPEDWSSQRTRYLPEIGAHQKLRLTWDVQAVNSGSFAIFVAVLPRHGAGPVTVSQPLRVTVAQRRTLNSSGVLPLVLVVPGLVGLLALGARRRRNPS
ncbi:MAG: hypothetical protein ABI649_08450 [Gaiellaceae bacterium]